MCSWCSLMLTGESVTCPPFPCLVAHAVADVLLTCIKEGQATSDPRGVLVCVVLLCHGLEGDVSSMLVRNPPPPPRALRAHFVAKGQQLLAIDGGWWRHRSPKNFYSPSSLGPLCTLKLSLNPTLTPIPSPTLNLLLTLPSNLSLDPNANPSPNPNPNQD